MTLLPLLIHSFSPELRLTKTQALWVFPGTILE